MTTNRLSKEKSPYLLQHQHNPVDWHAWGEEAFEAAREQDKPIFLSIGYSSCYWCHVMERDSFESNEVARILNENFISIKVDREERPDVDQVYMDAALAMSGHGGWPLTAFLTTDLKPFFAATFFPKAQFTQLLGKIAEMWENDSEELIASADSIVEHLNAESQLGKACEINADIFKKLYSQLHQNFDHNFGGFGPAPKFPPSQAIRNLLRIHRRSGSDEALNMATLTLEKMARGGIFDHLGGGFARYSVDERWLIPHFEKMLYDNALLIVTYLEAYQVTKNQMFKDVALRTIKYLMNEMYSEAFFSAQDAGDVGKEGEYYVWSLEELETLLNKEELELLKSAYGISDIGNFEEKLNVLNLQDDHDWSTRNNPIIESAFAKLRKQRDERHPPHLDDKILTSWNALMISALCKAAQVLNEHGYLQVATQCAEFIKNHLYKNGKLLRRYRGGESGIAACLDDYAYMIQACLDLYEMESNPIWLNWALDLQLTLDQDFWSENAYHFPNPESQELIFRKKDLVDNATPSGNGVAALNLLRLYSLTYQESFKQKAEELILNTQPMAEKYPAGFNSILLAVDFLLGGPFEIVAFDDEQTREFLYKEFIPNKVVVWGKDTELKSPSLAVGKKPGATYICKNQSCLAPITELEELKRELGKIEKYLLS